MEKINLAGGSKYFSISSRDNSTNEEQEYLGIGSDIYILFEADYDKLQNDYFEIPFLELELAAKAKLIYVKCDVYDYDSNVKIGTYYFDAQRMVRIPITQIYSSFGKVKIKIIDSTSIAGNPVYAAIFEDPLYIHYSSNFIKHVESLNVTMERTTYIEGEKIDFSDVTVNAVYKDGTSDSNVSKSDYDCSITRGLLITDTEVTFSHGGKSVTKSITVIPVKNKGLKPYTKQLSGNVGGIGYHINTNLHQSNLLFTIPVIETGGVNPLSEMLIYNHQDRSIQTDYGYGNRSIYDINVVELSDIEVINNDGSIDTYTITNNVDEYCCYDNQQTIVKEKIQVDGDSDEYTGIYKLIDKKGNVIKYNSNTNSIDTIEYVNGFITNYKPSEGVLLTNNDDKEIRYVSDEFNRVIEVAYYQNNVQKAYTTFEYDDNGNLGNITINEYGTIVQNYCFEYADTFIRIVDDKNGYAVKFYIDGNDIYKVEENLYSIELPSETYVLTETRVLYTIDRNLNETIITDRNGDTLTIVFNNELEAFEYDNKGNVKAVEYNNRNQLKHQSNVMNINKLKSEGVVLTSGVMSNDITVTDGELSNHASTLGFTNNKELSGIGYYNYNNITFEGTKDEAVSLIMYAKQNVVQSSTNITKLSVSLYNESTLVGYEEYSFINAEADTSGKVVVLGINPTDNYTKASVSVYVNGVNVEISELILCKCDYGSYYEYDGNYNLVSILNSKAHLYKGYSNNYIESEVVKGNVEKVYSYDDNMNPIKAVKQYGISVENEYDDKNRVVKTTTTSKNNGSVSETYTYNGDNLIKIEDDLDNVIEFEYDEYNRVQSITNNGIMTENVYTGEDLTEISYNGISDIAYSLDIRNNIKTITARNGSVYTFNYDYKNRLISVSLNDINIVSYTYDSNDNVTIKKYSDNEYYTFTYEDKLLTSINYVNSNIYSYTYDEYDRLISINDLANTIETMFTYDEYDRVNKVSNNDMEIKYMYHEADNDINLKRTVKDYTLYEGYNNVINTNVASSNKLRGLFYNNSDYAGSMFINDGILRCNTDDKTTVLNSNITEEMLMEYSDVPSVKIDSNNPKIIVQAVDNHNFGGVGFWFNIPNKSGNNYYPLFSKYNLNNDSKIFVDYNNDKLSLKLDSSLYTESYEIVASTSTSAVDGWNFFGLIWNFNGNTLDCYLRLNDEIIHKQVTTLGQIALDEEYYRIADFRLNESYLTQFSGYIAGMMVSISNGFTNDMLTEYYNTTKMYLINDPQLNLRTEAVDYQSVSNYKVIDNYEIYPLHGHANSITGKKPKSIKTKNNNIHDKSDMYNFNIKNRRYCLEANGNTLEYRFGNSSTGTICANVYFYKLYGIQYIFEEYDSNDNRIGLFVNTNGVLGYKLGNTTYLTNLTLEANTWNFVGLTYSLLSGTSYQCLIRLGNENYSLTLNPAVAYSEMTTIIGSNKDYTNPLYGQIEMLIVSTTKFLNSSEFNSFKSNLNVETKTHEYDDLGRLVKQDVTVNNSNVIINYPEYDDVVDNYTATKTKYSYNVKQERIRTGNTELVVREYGYGSGVNKNNVVSITDSVFGNKSYGYDSRGYLTNDNGTNITYDSNGNILTYGNNTYTYDSLVKDKLTSYNGNQITYSSSNPLYVEAYKTNTYYYQGNKLTRIVNEKDISTTITNIYSYDQNGLRVKKSVSTDYNDDRDSTSDNTYYYYEGNKLITEYRSDTDRLDFLYDNNGLLYGFINNKTDRYYYVRDVLQNILGIIDSNYNLVVKYDYNAFGKVSIVSDTSGIDLAHRNPFRYKGYYYDEETGLFWCNSRYYNPEWGRWISPDSIEYLDPSSINGLNLYCYCENDPVNYKQCIASLQGSNMTSANSSISRFNGVGGNLGTGSSNIFISPWYVQMIVGAIPDLYTGGRYLAAKGMHQYFAYKKNYYYMFPILGKTHNRLAINSTKFGKMTSATFKELITGNSKAGIGSVIGNVAGTGLLTLGTNLFFNLCENGFDVTDGDMWIDTGIDTAIGMGAYGLSIGTASLATAGLAMAGVALPGVVVVGGVIVLSIGFEHLIRAISGYWD